MRLKLLLVLFSPYGFENTTHTYYYLMTNILVEQCASAWHSLSIYLSPMFLMLLESKMYILYHVAGCQGFGYDVKYFYLKRGLMLTRVWNAFKCILLGLWFGARMWNYEHENENDYMCTIYLDGDSGLRPMGISPKMWTWFNTTVMGSP